MVPQHAKSPCCAAPVYRYGARRRQCRTCRKTWTLRPRRRGRPKKRLTEDLLRRVFLEGYSLSHLARHRPRIKQVTLRHHFRRLMSDFVSRPRRIRLPAGPLVLLLDGLWFRFGMTPWVLYQLALKPVTNDKAVFLDPVLLEGKESATNWSRAIASIPAYLQHRIAGVTVDNLSGLQRLARRRGWILQLCQFHLLLKFYGRRGMLAHSLRGGNCRGELHRAVRQALLAPPGEQLSGVLARLSDFSVNPAFTSRIHAATKDFIRSIDHYRAHLTHASLRMPSTTNAVESRGARLRDLFKKHRSATTPRSVLLWATVFTRLRQEIVCNRGISTE